MKNLILVLLLFSFNGYSQSCFQKTYGTIKNDGYGTMVRTNDGGYVIAGSSFGFAALYADIYIYKIDSIGNLLWNRAFVGPRVEEVCQLRKTSDQGFIILFGSNSSDTTNTKLLVCLVKTDSMGNRQWTKTYDVVNSVNNNYPKEVIETIDHGFIIGSGTQGLDLNLIKTDSAGALQWAYSYGSGIFYSIKEFSNGDLLLLGYSQIPGPYYRIILSKMDSSGIVYWSKVYTANGNEQGIKIISADSSGIVIAGQTTNYAQGQTDLLLLSLDTNGAVIWGKTYGGPLAEYLSDAAVKSDGGYLLFGSTTSFIFGTSFPDVYAVSVDSHGNLLWSKHYGTIAAEYAYSVLTTPDNGFIMACTGGGNFFGNGQGDSYIIKTDSLGNSFCHEGSADTKDSIYFVTDSAITFVKMPGGIEKDALYQDSSGIIPYIECYSNLNSTFEYDKKEIRFDIIPNPSSSKIKIVFDEQLFSDLFFKNENSYKIKILDIIGREIPCNLYFNKSRDLDITFLRSGIYFLQFNINQQTVGRKFIKY